MLALVAALSLVMGTVLGLLGGGGSILSVPILAYAAGMPAGEAIAASLVVVGATSAVAAARHAFAGHVLWRTAGLFGISAMVGSYAGGRLASVLPDWLQLALFAVLMLTTATLMLRGRSKKAVDRTSKKRAWPIVAVLALAVGAVTGLIGAGGGFLIVPALTLVAGLPMREAVGTSLVVIAMNSVSAVGGHLHHVHIDWNTTLVVTAIAIVGSLVGSTLSKKVSETTLRVGFAWFVLAMGAFILIKELAPIIF